MELCLGSAFDGNHSNNIYSRTDLRKKTQSSNKKFLFAFFVILALLPLLLFKYYDFINYQVSSLLSAFNIANEIRGLNWIIPVGISFYTFQAVGYVFDVYYGRTKAEHNFWDYTLFVAFFPQIMSGPISKAKDLLPQIKEDRMFDYLQAVSGCKFLLWGFFLKLVFADQIGLYVDSVMSNHIHVGGGDLALATVLYSLQIYGDFAGYSLMAVGVGKIMGFNLVNNFNRPYFSASITEFWKRWHISLTKWLTSCVYIPLGGSRCSKFKTYRNILVTFLVSGIWHGANLTFIFWGLMHGLLQILEKMLGIQKAKTGWFRNIRIIAVFITVSFLWIFFRVPSIGEGFDIISKIIFDFGRFSPQGQLPSSFVAIPIIIVFVKEWFNEFHPKISLMGNRHLIIRWTTYIILFCMIILCGVLDASSFIYVNF